MKDESYFSETRRKFHLALNGTVLKTDSEGIPSNADKHNKNSIEIARGIFDRLGFCATSERVIGQSAGSQFEEICKNYLHETFTVLDHLRPGTWKVSKGIGKRSSIAGFDQYEHLATLESAAKENRQLAAVLGNDYLIKPDVVVVRLPEKDRAINLGRVLVDELHARQTPLRRINNNKPILHASVSCKWTIRSDRAQNARSEALNLVRNRKGNLPHIVVVTGEPTPSRIASIALGTGDIDCVYHFALPELQATVSDLGHADSEEMLGIMIDGKRLRDISDLPLDLAI